MKKNLFLALAVAGALASCSNDEVLSSVDNPQPTAIRFDGFVNKSTRATADNELTKTILGGFAVYGGVNNPADGTNNVGVLFDNVKVYNTNNSATSYSGATWTYDNLRYWTMGNNYSFTAIAPHGAASYAHGNVSADGNNITVDGTSVAAKPYNLPHGTITFTNSNGNTDLGYAFATFANVTPSSQGAVGFTFNHLLSKVKVKFVNGFPSSSSYINVSNVTIKSASGGTLDMSGLTSSTVTRENIAGLAWNITGALGLTTTYNFANSDPTKTIAFANDNPQTSSNWFYLMPSQNSIKISFNANIVVGGVEQKDGGYDHTVTLNFGGAAANQPEKFKPGQSYVLVATLNNENINTEGALYPILFSVEDVEEWAPENTIYCMPNTEIAATGTANLEIPAMGSGEATIEWSVSNSTALQVTQDSTDKHKATIKGLTQLSDGKLFSTIFRAFLAKPLL